MTAALQIAKPRVRVASQLPSPSGFPPVDEHRLLDEIEAPTGTDRTTLSRFSVRAGEGKLLNRLAKIIELRQKPEPDLESLPVKDLPEDRIDEGEITRLISDAPRDFSDVFARIETMKRK